jgi:hypothetical protein
VAHSLLLFAGRIYKPPSPRRVRFLFMDVPEFCSINPQGDKRMGNGNTALEI